MTRARSTLHTDARWITIHAQPTDVPMILGKLVTAAFHCYYPQIMLQNETNSIRIPMFNGYFFVKIDPRSAEQWQQLEATAKPYPLQIICGENGWPNLVPAGIIENLQVRRAVWNKSLARQLEVDDLLCPRVAGNRLRIRCADSPFDDIDSIVQWTNAKRVALLLDLLHKETVNPAMFYRTNCRAAARERHDAKMELRKQNGNNLHSTD